MKLTNLADLSASLARLPEVRVGVVGNDPWGHALRRIMRAQGADDSGMIDSSQECVFIVDSRDSVGLYEGCALKKY